MIDVLVIGTGDSFELLETALPGEVRIVGYLAPEPNAAPAYAPRAWLGTDAVLSSDEYSDASVMLVLYDNARRRQIAVLAEAGGRRLLTVVHPSSTVMPTATVGNGSSVAFNCTVSSHAVLGNCVVVRSQVHIAHDARIGDFTFIGPGARILGGAVVGENVLIGANAVVFPNRRIGAGARVGAGTIVTKDVSPGETAHAGRRS